MLGIVIVSYHSDERTVRFVRNELSRIVIPHRIVIVDNGVGAGNVSPLAALLPEADVLSTDNKGFSAGNNAGAAWLAARYPVTAFLFTNNDIHLSSDDVADRMYQSAPSARKWSDWTAADRARRDIWAFGTGSSGCIS